MGAENNSCTQACVQQGQHCVDGAFPQTANETKKLADAFNISYTESATTDIEDPRCPYDNCKPPSKFLENFFHTYEKLVVYSSKKGRAPCDDVPVEIHGWIEGIRRLCECSPTTILF